MRNFITFLAESAAFSDFPEKFGKALKDSEDLRVAMELMQHMRKEFPQGEIYIVGGVPRDLMMGNAVDDVDLATNIPFEVMSKKFELRNISKNDSQPVYAILYKNYVYDLAKFRTDSGDEGRQNNVSTEVDSFRTDSKRRDLTINAFGINPEGQIVDYQNGLEDLNNKLVRTVGNAKDRYIEDATRILRVFRFAAKMNFDIEENTLQAAKELKHLLSDKKHISSESISKEFYKAAYSGKTLANFLVKLQNAGILHDILPEFTAMEGFTHDPKHHPEGDSQVIGHILECLRVSPYNDPVINLAVMLHDFGKATTRAPKGDYSSYHGHEGAGVPIVENIFRRLVFSELSQQDKKKILFAVGKHMLIHNLDKLNNKTIAGLVNSPAWDVVKAVGYCDEASRGAPLFDPEAFAEKIHNAEAKMQKLGDHDTLNKKIASYVNGNMVMQWFPELNNVEDKSIFKELLPPLREYVLDMIESGDEPDVDYMKEFISNKINS